MLAAGLTGDIRTGVVIIGDQRGRVLGFPTANMVLDDDDSIADGVYAGWLQLEGGTRRPAAISIGRRPTFGIDGTRLLEAHLLDFEGDLYGQTVRVGVGQFLRSQRTFPSADALVAQLRRDTELTRRFLTEVTTAT